MLITLIICYNNKILFLYYMLINVLISGLLGGSGIDLSGLGLVWTKK